ncbi:MAG: DUF1974 domain-containing protein [Sulfurisoma sp.]|nr:DUF1974 domain-containing protein [Sulfurisoma sp.]
MHSRRIEAFDGVIAGNYPNRIVGWLLRQLIFPWGHPYVLPSDRIGHEVAKRLIAPSATRDRLTAECHLPDSEDDPVGAIELALAATLVAEPVEANIRAAEPPRCLAERVARGELGRKTGSGFHRYADGQKVGAGETATEPGAQAVLATRLVTPLIERTRQFVAEGIVADADLADAGVIFGTGFASFTGGPLHYRAQAA